MSEEGRGRRGLESVWEDCPETHQLGEEGSGEQEVGERESWKVDHTPPWSEIKAISSDSRKQVL